MEPTIQTKRTVNRAKFPWLALLVLMASIYFFWIYPIQRPVKEIQVEFLPAVNAPVK